MSVYGKANYTCDLDGIKKKELERRKKLRLEQVRAQSKELSMQIRDRVAKEKYRQLRNIEEIKAKEFLSWKEQHVNSTMADYYYCLSNVGDAHVAAERENEVKEQMEAQQRENRRIAAIRGQKALQNERLKNSKKNERLLKKKPSHKTLNLVRKEVEKDPPRVLFADEDDVVVEDDANQSSESDEESIAKSTESLQESVSKSLEIPKHTEETHYEEKNEPVVRFTQVADLIEERRRRRNLSNQILENSADVSKPEVRSKSPKPIPYLRTKSPEGSRKLHENKPVPASKSPQQTKSPATTRKFIPRSNLSFQIDKANSNILKKNLPRNSQLTSTKKDTTPIKANPKVTSHLTKSMKAASPSKFTLPQRREFVPRFIEKSTATARPGILKNRNNPVITETNRTEPPEKVQFYDHFSRYGKEYEALPGMVERESVPPTMTATEAARVQNEMDAIRFQQLEELKQKSEQRSKESLEKNQIRKDYDSLTKQLDEFCKEDNRLRTFAMPNEQFSEERLTQLARNRQQSMNRAFEDIYHKPVVITCPPIGSNQNSSSSDVNVATLPSPDEDQQRMDPFDSSDSCTSILLGYVDNRSRRLIKDIKQCNDNPGDDKRKKLIKLLARLDQLRKLMMEEIVKNSSLNLEPFYRSVIEVETKKKKILCDPSANKENSDMKEQAEQLKKREKILKSQELKLEKKIEQLFRKESKAAQVTDDNTFESLTSETVSSSVDQSDPVKILIEVKNAAKVVKLRRSKKNQNTDHDVVSKSQHKSSVGGSSASTAYRSPPTTFQTDLTKVLTNQTAVKPTKATGKPKQASSLDQKTPLVHYITRLLGMSQQSIDQLGVSSSSSIATPSDSVINVPANVSSSSVIDENHLKRTQMKIDEISRFTKEVDDSFSQLKNQAEVDNFRKKMLDRKEQEAKPVKERQHQPKESATTQKSVPKNLRSDGISKLPPQSKKLSIQKKKSEQTEQLHSDEVLIATDIPENSKRIIADLTKQIEQVRQEKQKLLEKTLSSAHSSNSSSGKGFDSTEYRDFVIPSHHPAEENNCSSQASEVLSLPGQYIDEESKNLMTTKQIGISFSRDSGIGSSRPVTSTDFRVSPDIKFAEKSTVPAQASKTPDDASMEVNDPQAGSMDPSGKSATSSLRKSAKPPISLKRYSPQLDTEPLQPHDLSTINEVETSVASRLNPSTRNETSDSSVPAQYTKFPTFLEYAKMHQEIASIDSSSDMEKSYSETVLKKMLEVTCLSETDLNYRKLNEMNRSHKDTSDKSTNKDNVIIDVDKEIRRRRLMEIHDVSSSPTEKLSSSTSSDLLVKDFNQIGLNWASAMLKKTSTAQNLTSSSSSNKSVSNVGTKNQPISDMNSPDDRINGNPLNIREFLARELQKRTQLSTSSSISDNSTLTDQFLKSLLSSSTTSSVQQQATLRTSTPNRVFSSDSEKCVALQDNVHSIRDEVHLFSGESILSSVRCSSHSETSGAKETSE